MRFTRSTRRLVLIAGVSLLATVASTAPAAVILTTADGTGADTHISNDTNEASNTNQGSDGSTAIRHYDAVRAKLTYWRFDLSGVTGDLSGATLTLTFTSANRARTMNVHGLTDETGDAWGEGTITYENAPGIVQPADGGVDYNSGSESIDATRLSVVTDFTTPASAAAVTTAADADVDNFLAADTNGLVTFVFYPSGSDTNASYFVASKESTAGATAFPTLTLPNATLVPEPAAASLLVLGGVATLARRRRA